MTQASLKNELRSMVREHGFEQVSQSLEKIGLSEHRTERTKRNVRSTDRSAVTAVGNTRSRVTAPEHVARMDLPVEKETALAELARRFEDKAFMPAFGDIANFCQIHGIDEPASRSRASAIPRVFKFIASMEADEIQRLLDLRMFSGPARLGPIADAIRSSGRARRSSAGSSVAS